MRIEIKEILDSEKKIVNFESQIGVGIGLWKSSIAPVKNAIYSIEFNINDFLILGENAFEELRGNYSISISNNNMILEGIIEDIDEDGMAYYRLGTDCIIMLESDKENLYNGMWLKIIIDILDVEIWT